MDCHVLCHNTSLLKGVILESRMLLSDMVFFLVSQQPAQWRGNLKLFIENCKEEKQRVERELELKKILSK